jgi:hypothetical protein
VSCGVDCSRWFGWLQLFEKCWRVGSPELSFNHGKDARRYPPTGLCYHTFMAKSKSKPADRYPNPKPANYSNLFVAGKSPVPQEGFGLPGKTYNVPSYAVKTLSLPQPNTPVVRDSGSSLRGMQGQGSFDPSTKNVVRAALAAGSVGAGSAASTFRVVRGVSETAKKVQRELAKEVKGESTKGMSRIQREGFYEERAELLPGELESHYARLVAWSDF